MINKMDWDLETTPLTITGISTKILQLDNSGGEFLTIKNVRRQDLEMIRSALQMYHGVDYQLEELKKSVDASTSEEPTS